MSDTNKQSGDYRRGFRRFSTQPPPLYNTVMWRTTPQLYAFTLCCILTIGSVFAFASNDSSSPVPSRASPAQVGTVMALLAAFQDADVLPPESSPEANRLIKALIQFQAAFMKSQHPAVTHWLREAVTMQGGPEAAAEVERFRARGWTARSLEAVVDYAEGRALWDNAGMDEGFRAYHVGRDDFELLARTVRAARAGLAARGDTLHGTYTARRREMPGAKQ